jgi:dephospho-CoA kinase
VIVVGLTGGIGSGKSTVSERLAAKGAVIVDADRIARDLQHPGSPVLVAMAERFGSHIIEADGSLDRAGVANIVFNDAEALADLNAIVHPAMQAEIESQITAHRGSERVVILDFPLLTENPRPGLSAIIVVDVDPELAIERLVEQRGMDRNDARARVASQASRGDRLATASHVIDNSGDLGALQDRIDAIWLELLELERAARGS